MQRTDDGNHRNSLSPAVGQGSPPDFRQRMFIVLLRFCRAAGRCFDMSIIDAQFPGEPSKAADESPVQQAVSQVEKGLDEPDIPAASFQRLVGHVRHALLHRTRAAAMAVPVMQIQKFREYKRVNIRIRHRVGDFSRSAGIERKTAFFTARQRFAVRA